MPVRVITIEREYGSGGANIAKQVAERLRWKLWDEEITAEIARAASALPSFDPGDAGAWLRAADAAGGGTRSLRLRRIRLRGSTKMGVRGKNGISGWS